jgi:hypothetical protein
MEAGDCAAAEPHFEKALSLHPHNQIAGNLGACELELKKYHEAAVHLQMALDALAAENAAAEKQTALKDMFERTRLHVGHLSVALGGYVRAPSTVRVDGVPIAGTNVFVTPGQHVVDASGPGGRSAAVTVTVEAGDSLTVALTLARDQESGPVDAPAEGVDDGGVSWPLIGALVSYGVALAATGVGVGTFIAGGSAQGDADARRDEIRAAGGTCAGDCPELTDMYGSADTLYNTSVATFAVGGVAALLGTALLTVALVSDDTESARVTLSPLAIGPDNFVIGLRGAL